MAKEFKKCTELELVPLMNGSLSTPEVPNKPIDFNKFLNANANPFANTSSSSTAVEAKTNPFLDPPGHHVIDSSLESNPFADSCAIPISIRSRDAITPPPTQINPFSDLHDITFEVITPSPILYSKTNDSLSSSSPKNGSKNNIFMANSSKLSLSAELERAFDIARTNEQNVTSCIDSSRYKTYVVGNNQNNVDVIERSVFDIEDGRGHLNTNNAMSPGPKWIIGRGQSGFMKLLIAVFTLLSMILLCFFLFGLFFTLFGGCSDYSSYISSKTSDTSTTTNDSMENLSLWSKNIFCSLGTETDSIHSSIDDNENILPGDDSEIILTSSDSNFPITRELNPNNANDSSTNVETPIMSPQTATIDDSKMNNAEIDTNTVDGNNNESMGLNEASVKMEPSLIKESMDSAPTVTNTPRSPIRLGNPLVPVDNHLFDNSGPNKN